MKYYLIAGEASGDLHASHLMQALKKEDAEATFRFYGGDQMAAVEGGTLVRHYRELAYMGFVPVLLHLPTILKNMRRAKEDIQAWQPDVVILVDYPGFNLSIAKYVHKKAICPVYYYISPKIWAWKEHRIKNIKRDVDELFSILPFEVEFFEQKHHYPIHYVGNPTADEVRKFFSGERREESGERRVDGGLWMVDGGERIDSSLDYVPETDLYPLSTIHHPLKATIHHPLKIALLCGSRRQEIRDNLPSMLRVTDKLGDQYEVVIAGAPGIDPEYYRQFMEGHRADIVFGQTYDLLAKAHAALVTSGTATLETALFRVPQVVCYETALPQLFGWLRRNILKVKYISLVNLVADREVVRELVADTFSEENIEQELAVLLPDDSPQRLQMLQGYDDVAQRLGDECAPENAARLMVGMLSGRGSAV